MNHKPNTVIFRIMKIVREAQRQTITPRGAANQILDALTNLTPEMIYASDQDLRFADKWRAALRAVREGK